MGLNLRLSTWAFAVVSILALAYGAVLLTHDYSWAEMDWNQDGHTSIREFFMAIDVGKREISITGKRCIEYYAYKDGLPVKALCS